MPGPHATDFDPAAAAVQPDNAVFDAGEPPELTGLELSAAGTLELAPLPELPPLEDTAEPAGVGLPPSSAEASSPATELIGAAEPVPAEPTATVADLPAAEPAASNIEPESAVTEPIAPAAEAPAEPPSATAVPLPHDDDPAYGDDADEDGDPSPEDSSAGALPATGEAEVPDAGTSRLSAPISPLRALEAVLFAAHEPLAPARLGAVVGDLDARTVRKMVEQLNLEYEGSGRAFRIEEIAGGFQVLTKPEYNTWLKKLFKSRSEGKLSQTAMLTLAIVAYKQPIKRVDIEGIRGAACGEVLRALMDKGLVKITGREESLGRPLLYGTTKKFLQLFGLASLKELPKAEELAKP